MKILESYGAPVSLQVDGAEARTGTGLLAVRVLADELWSATKSEELAGFSIGGSAATAPAARRDG